MKAATARNAARQAINSVGRGRGALRSRSATAPSCWAAAAAAMVYQRSGLDPGNAVPCGAGSSDRPPQPTGGRIDVPARVSRWRARNWTPARGRRRPIRIGGDYQAGSLQRADTLTADAATRIRAADAFGPRQWRSHHPVVRAGDQFRRRHVGPWQRRWRQWRFRRGPQAGAFCAIPA